MVRIQLHLTEAQDRKLRALARKRGVSRAEVIRRGIDLALGEDVEADDPLLQIIGMAGPGGREDVSERHDDYLYATARPAKLKVGERKAKEK